MSDDGPAPDPPGGHDPEAERLGVAPDGPRPSPLGLALGGAAAVVGAFALLEGTVWLALVAYPVVFLGGLLAGVGWPRHR